MPTLLPSLDLAAERCLGLNQLRFLLLLRGSPNVDPLCHSGAIVRRMNLSFSAGTGIVDFLLGRNLITAARDPQDERKVVLTLTPEGIAAIDAIERGG